MRERPEPPAIKVVRNPGEVARIWKVREAGNGSTALIPGKPAPELITAAMVASMKPGSVIVDLAAANGGNCKQTKKDDVVFTQNGVTIIGYTNLASRAASDASPLYARNLQTFVMTLMFDKDTRSLKIASDDELIKGTLVTKGGAVVHPALAR